MSGVALFEFDWFEDVEVIQWRMPVPLCRRCLNGEYGECHTPGCTFAVLRSTDEDGQT